MSATGRLARNLTILALAAFLVLAWWQNMVFKPWAGAGQGPDGLFGGYDAAWFAAWANELDPVERWHFGFWHLRVFDLVFPLLFAMALITLSLAAFARHPGFAGASPVKRVALAAALPLAVFFLDLLENRGIGALLAGQVPVDARTVAHLSAVTGAKWLFGLFAVAFPVGVWLSSRNSGGRNG